MITVLLWILAAIALLVIAAVSLPLKVRVRATSSPRTQLRIQGSALGSPWITFVDSARPAGTSEPDKPAKTSGAKKRRKRRNRRSRIPAGIPDAVGGVLREIRIARLWATGEVGLGDPADTGVLFGLLTPLIHGARGDTIRLDVRPAFDRAHIGGNLDAIVQVTLIRLAPVAATFAWRNAPGRW